jgi:uncharacterized membrane protein YhdT
MTRSTPQWTWVGTASGVLFVATQFAGFGTGAAARDFKRITLTSSSSEVAESVATPVATAAWVGGYVEVAAYLAFLVFVACLAAALHGAQAGPAWPSFTVLAAGVMVVATSMIGYAAEGAAYLRAGGGIDSSNARALFDVANIAFVLGWSMLAILLLAAAGSHVLPRWLGIAATALGITFLVAFAAPSLPVGEVADLALWVWIITVSVILARRSAHRPDEKPMPAGEH